MEEKHSFWVHIEDLRKRVLRYIIILLILVILSFIFIKPILFILLRLIDTELVFLSPTEGFAIVFQLALLVGFILSLPFLLFHIWGFISSALTEKEKKKLKIYLFISFLLFIAG